MDAKIKEETGPDYSSFPIDRLVDNSVTDFDLFLNVQNHFVLYSAAGYKWLKDELDSLIKNGYVSFSIKNNDVSKATTYQKVALIPAINKAEAPKKRIQSIQEVGSTFVQYLHEGNITQACVEKAKSIVESMVGCIAEDPTCIQALANLADHDYYTYNHSVRVASYATAIAIEMGLKDEAKLKEIGLGGIFHDVGKKNVPLEVINKSGALTPKEWDSMRSHPEHGLKNVEDTILSHVPREIIVHHHEKMDGSGYPHALEKNSLIMEVQIATVADIFDALTSNRTYQVSRTHFEALQLIRDKFLGPKLPHEPFKALISCLAQKSGSFE